MKIAEELHFINSLRLISPKSTNFLSESVNGPQTPGIYKPVADPSVGELYLHVISLACIGNKAILVFREGVTHETSKS